MAPKNVISKKILILENDPGTLDAIQIILESEGYDLIPVTSSDSLLQKRPLPDLYVLDTYWLGKRYLEILTSLKSGEMTRNIPVIIMSDTPEYKDIALSCGATAFIEKPFRMQDFIKMVSLALV